VVVVPLGLDREEVPGDARGARHGLGGRDLAVALDRLGDGDERGPPGGVSGGGQQDPRVETAREEQGRGRGALAVGG
jgi:hypothetical protein